MADEVKEKDATKLTPQDPEDISMVQEETISKIEAGLKAIGHKESTPSEPADDKGTEESAESKDTTPTPEPKKSTPAKPAEEKIELPDVYRRAMIHQEWTTEEIDDLFKSDPDRAVKIGQKLYETTNRLSAQFAAAGQVKSQPVVHKVEPQVTGGFKGIDRKKVIESMDGDERVGGLVDQFNQMLESQQKQIEELKQVSAQHPQEPDFGSQEQNRKIDHTVKSFFGDDSFQKQYGDFYGKDEDLRKNTVEQSERRVQLVELADAIMAGSILAGQDMSIERALSAAHLCVAKDQIEPVIRDNIQKSLVKRQKSMTLVPSGTKIPDKPLTYKEKEASLEARVAERIAKVNW